MGIELQILGIEHIIFEAIKSIRSGGTDVVTEQMIFDVINEEQVKKITNRNYEKNIFNNTICIMIENDLLEKLEIKHKDKKTIIVIFTIRGNNYLNYLRDTGKTLFPNSSEKAVYHWLMIKLCFQKPKKGLVYSPFFIL